jgi:methylation protein EvaC
LNAIVSDLKFERFYFDRPHYYSAAGLSLLGRKVGFDVEKVESVDTHGGSLRIWFRKRSAAHRQDLPMSQLVSVSHERVLDGFQAWVSEGKRLVVELSKMRDSGQTVVGYGAPARLATICNFFQIDESLIKLVVDDSWLKQGRLSPGTHIPIKKLDEVDMHDVDCLIIFAYEYTKQIKLKVMNEFVKSDYRSAIPYRSI